MYDMYVYVGMYASICMYVETVYTYDIGNTYGMKMHRSRLILLQGSQWLLGLILLGFGATDILYLQVPPWSL